MQYLQIVDWDIYQTYRKDRGTPPWIKVHRTLFSSRKWSGLTDAEKGQLVSIWLIGADKKGIVPADPNTLRKICLLDNPPNIQRFIDLGYLSPIDPPHDNQATTTCQPSDVSETETETETETEKHIVQEKPLAHQPLRPLKPSSHDEKNNHERDKFEKVWKAYPTKKGKEKAWIKFKNQVKTDQDFEDIQKALENYKIDVNKIRRTVQPDLQFKNGLTWFTHDWKDYVDMTPPPQPETPYIPPPEPKERVRGEPKLEKLWDDALVEIKADIKPNAFEIWFKPTYPKIFEDGRLVVAVPNQFIRKSLIENYRGKIEKTLRNLNGKPVLVDFCIQP